MVFKGRLIIDFQMVITLYFNNNTSETVPDILYASLRCLFDILAINHNEFLLILYTVIND